MIRIQSKTVSGIVTKLLIALNEQESTEISLIERPTKNIICFSCMLGCPVGCSFCVSGVLDNYARKLTVDEMLQCIFLAKSMAKYPFRRWVLSAMGEGEPALNAEAVVTTLRRAPLMFGAYSLAVSTSAPNKTAFMHLLRLVDDPNAPPIKLQYSLHSNRNQLFRTNHTPAGWVLTKLSPNVRRRINVELNITLIEGVNDSPEHLKEVLSLLRLGTQPWYIKINRFNPSPEMPSMLPSSDETYTHWKDVLKEARHVVEYYETDGTDISAACGQLRANVNKSNGALSRLAALRARKYNKCIDPSLIASP